MASKVATWIAFRSIVKRSLAVAIPARTVLHRYQTPHRLSSFQTTVSDTSEFSKHPVTTALPLHQDHPSTPVVSPKRKPSRTTPATSSLRRVAAEAQWSREGIIRGRGKTRHVDPDAETKDVTAYCAAETYHISVAKRLLCGLGYVADPLGTGLYPQVLHVQTPSGSVREGDGEVRGNVSGVGDVFVFPSGSVVTWNVPEGLARKVVEQILPPAAENGHLDRLEVEDLEYLEDASSETSEIVGDTIILGTKSSIAEPSHQNRHPKTTLLIQIAISSALARSAKLSVLESALSTYFSSTRAIPSTLSTGSPLRYTRKFILRKTGELLSIRAQLNLYSELTDSLPDLFWDSPYELGLEGYYEQVGKALDVGVRIRGLNEKMDYASEIAGVLRERLSEKHSAGLEWLIIGLISVEVGFEILRIWRESGERRGVEETQALLREYLARQLRL